MKQNHIVSTGLFLLAITIGLIGSVPSAVSQTGRVIETIAGIGGPGFSGDGGPATQARFGTLSALAVDAAGNVYLSDITYHRVRRIDQDGIITTIAGTGAAGFNGDDRPATTAQLATPAGLAVDAVGRLYIADLGNHRIRRVDTNGTITTIAGTGTRDFSGDGGPATAASFSYPSDVVFDGLGNIFITDVGNYRVRKIDPDSIVSTVAGNGQRAFSGDGGPAQDASFRETARLAVTATNDLLVVDRFSHRLRHIDQNNIINTLAGNGTYGYNGDHIPANQASLRFPQDVAIDQSGAVYITDSSNHRVRRIDADGTITTMAGNGVPAFAGDGGLADQASLNNPSSVAVDATGTIYIADSFNYRIRVVRPAGKR
jgi:sugar lactone lactonase YvrE